MNECHTVEMTLSSRLGSLLLAGFALSFLPLSLAALCFNYAVLALTLRPSLRSRLRHNPGFQRRTILITGIGTPQGLHLARTFYGTGHNVIGADAGQKLLPLHARFSNSLYKFRRLRHSLVEEPASDYILEILDLIQKYNIELWIDSSQQRISGNLRQAKLIVERRSRCLCFLPSDNLAAAFTNSDVFLDFTRSQGLPGLDSRQVGSRAEIHNVLNDSRGKKRYVLSGPDAPPARTLLPRRTLSQTYNEISKVKIQKDRRLHLKQYVEGQERYTTVGVVVKGELKCFAASPLSTSHCFQALPPSSAINRSLLSYVKALCDRLGPGYTGHICIDFCAEDKASARGVEKAILPFDGRIGPDASLLLFQGLDGTLDLARSYLSIFLPIANGAGEHNDSSDQDVGLDTATPAWTDKGFYSFGYDVFQLALLPLIQMLNFKVSPNQLIRGATMLVNHVVFWQECVYDFADPLPFWWLYQVYLPVTLILSLFQKQSRTPSSNMQLMIR